MASEGLRAHGTMLQIGDGADPEEFTDVAEVTNISGPSLSRETFDLTSHSSEGSWREFGVGLKDAGEVTLDINYVPSNPTHDAATGLLAQLDTESNDPTNYQIVFPDNEDPLERTVWSFAAYCTAFSTSAPVGDLLGASVTLKLTGAPTLA